MTANESIYFFVFSRAASSSFKFCATLLGVVAPGNSKRKMLFSVLTSYNWSGTVRPYFLRSRLHHSSITPLFCPRLATKFLPDNSPPIGCFCSASEWTPVASHSLPKQHHSCSFLFTLFYTYEMPITIKKNYNGTGIECFRTTLNVPVH